MQFFFMRNYLEHVGAVFLRLLWLLLFYSIVRLVFYFQNSSYFDDLSLLELFRLFVVGIRFDIAAIVFTNIIFIVFLLPGSFKNKPITQRVFRIFFLIVNAIAISSNMLDVRLFDFIHKRTSFAIFGLLGTNKDVWLMIPRFIKDFWHIYLLELFLLFAFWKYMPSLKEERLIRQKFTASEWIKQWILFVMITGLMFIGGRGIRLKPVSIIDAANYAELKHVPLVLNTPFTIIKTIEHENLSPFHFFPDSQLVAMHNPIHQYTSDSDFIHKNIVIIILESFSKEYSGYLSGGETYTPILDSLLRLSYVFPNAFANGTQSYEALSSIVAGIPSLMDKPYSGSAYADNYFESLPNLIRKEGYHTSFFHGGNNGTMGFNNFAHAAGIEHYMGRSEYNNDKDYDGYWGIWDEPFLQYFARQLDKFPQPFFSAVYTLSSHHPYRVPGKYANLFAEGPLPIHKSVRYADYSLGRFFSTAKKMSWFKETLFIITADHAAQTIMDKNKNTFGIYSIPLAIFSESGDFYAGIDSTIAQQIDIMPTILHYLNYEKPFFGFGESLFDTTTIHRSITYMNGIYQLIQDNTILQFNGEKTINSESSDNLFDNNNEIDHEIEIVTDSIKLKQKEKYLAAFLQTYNYCLINNASSLKQYSTTLGKKHGLD